MLVVGHSKEDGGAENSQGMNEYTFNKDIVMEIVRKDDFKGVDIIPKFRVSSRTNLPKEINEINPDIVISLHCNAYNASAQGTEVLYAEGSSKGKKYAEILQKNLLEWLHLPDRGIKSKSSGDRGGHLLWNAKAPCVIIEPLFIDAMTNDELEDAKNEIIEAVMESIWEML